MHPDLKALNERIQDNGYCEGFGINTVSVLPCPFCGARDWMRFPVVAGINDYADQQKDHSCPECERVARLVVFRPDAGTLSVELVQTGGADVPEWYEPKPRRM